MILVTVSSHSMSHVPLAILPRKSIRLGDRRIISQV